MDDLVRWLSAQLDEDERIARAATPGPWAADPDSDGLRRWTIGVVPHNPGVCIAYLPSTHEVAADAAHIVAWDPARVLREIDATRQIVKQHRPVGYGGVCLSLCHTRAPGQPQTWPCLTLRLLALPYADREGYREEWRP